MQTCQEEVLTNPYTVSNLMDVWECDILDMQSLSKYNYTYRSVIEVFSKYLNPMPTKTKSGPAVTSAFLSVLHDDSPPLWVRTDKGKGFLNKYFLGMLRDEDIQFQVCKNPDVKCAVVERFHRTIRHRFFK